MRNIITAMSALVPQLQKPVYLADCGHWAPQEQPKPVTEALLAFMESI